MLGNDLVDLSDPETRPAALHPRFDARVFCESERAFLASSPDSHRMRWTLWAAKESAYKCLRQCERKIVFSPSRFVVELTNPNAGIVRHEGRSLDVEFEQAADFVHAVAWSSDEGIQRVSGRLLARVRRLSGDISPEAASRDARRLAIEGASILLDVPVSELRIEREDRIPRLYWQGRRSEVDLSLSHHGSFVAFAARVLSGAVPTRGAA